LPCLTDSYRPQVSKLIYQRGTGNELLDFIKVQDPGQLKELTQHASSSVLEAMNTFIQRLVSLSISICIAPPPPNQMSPTTVHLGSVEF